MVGQLLPDVRGPLPGPRSRALIDKLARYECPAITQRRSRRAESLGAPHDDPVVWAQAAGSNVWDCDGNRFVDLTSGFGVTLMGHRHPAVVQAAQGQTNALIHAMGDAWPDQQRIELLERLAAFAPDPLSVAILGLSGSDAVDAAVKTAHLATGQPGVLVFEGGYHGLASGVLPLQSARPRFNEPFRDTARPFVYRADYGAPVGQLRDLLQAHSIGLVMVEPIRVAAALRCPPGIGWPWWPTPHEPMVRCSPSTRS